MIPPYPRSVEIAKTWELAEKIFIQSYSNKPYMKTNEMINLAVQAATEFRSQYHVVLEKAIQEEQVNLAIPPRS